MLIKYSCISCKYIWIKKYFDHVPREIRTFSLFKKTNKKKNVRSSDILFCFCSLFLGVR